MFVHMSSPVQFPQFNFKMRAEKKNSSNRYTYNTYITIYSACKTYNIFMSIWKFDRKYGDADTRANYIFGIFFIFIFARSLVAYKYGREVVFIIYYKMQDSELKRNIIWWKGSTRCTTNNIYDEAIYRYMGCLSNGMACARV